jgi:single-strand DNA-binding protein
MASLNKVFLIGRLGADVSLRSAGSQSVASFRIATDESYTDKSGQRVERTEWHSITVWGKAADHCANYLSKGSNVFVEGKLTTREYEKDGQKRYVTEVKADRVQFLDRRESGQQKPAQSHSKPSEMDDMPW